MWSSYEILEEFVHLDYSAWKLHFRTVVRFLVGWYFEPSQKQSITSGLKKQTNFNLSPIYSSRKSSNHKFPKNHKISLDTNLHKPKRHINVKHKIFQELVPSVLPLLKKKKMLGYAIFAHFRIPVSLHNKNALLRCLINDIL